MFVSSLEVGPISNRLISRSIVQGLVLPTAQFRTRAVDQAHPYYIRIPSPLERSISPAKLFSPFLRRDTAHTTHTGIPGYY